jgi:hypothetical protein
VRSWRLTGTVTPSWRHKRVWRPVRCVVVVALADATAVSDTSATVEAAGRAAAAKLHLLSMLFADRLGSLGRGGVSDLEVATDFVDYVQDSLATLPMWRLLLEATATAALEDPGTAWVAERKDLSRVVPSLREHAERLRVSAAQPDSAAQEIETSTAPDLKPFLQAAEVLLSAGQQAGLAVFRGALVTLTRTAQNAENSTNRSQPRVKSSPLPCEKPRHGPRHGRSGTMSEPPATPRPRVRVGVRAVPTWICLDT